MTRKHFIALADAIRTNISSKPEREAVAKALLNALRDANPRFKAEKFIEACLG